MPTLLVQPIHTLVTMDDDRREIVNAALFIRDGVIVFAGPADDLPSDMRTADDVMDLRHHIVIPGLVNAHHHMFQSLTRVFAQESELFGWLTTLYPVWQGLTADMVHTAALTSMSELLLSGCTTSSDHHYLFPNDVTLDDTIRAAQAIGLRFHPTRGSMSMGQSAGGLPPDSLVQDADTILTDTRRVIEAYHDPNRYAMLRVGVAPASPFNVSQDVMRESVALARSYGVRLHTHLAENASDITYSQERYGMRPGDYAEDVGFVGEDVWHAHCVQLNDAEIGLFSRTGTGVCHCPGSNMRLASGIAPVRAMLDAGVRVGLGVDGSASNDSGHLLNEARMAMLLQRVNGTPDPARMTARDALALATRGGAAVLGRDDIGKLAPQMAADFAAFRVDDPVFAGAGRDLVAALVFCQSARADVTVVNGRVLVRDGHLTTLDLPVLVEKHNRLSRQLVNGAP